MRWVAAVSVTSALLVVTMFAIRNKCHASSNRCLATSNKKLVVSHENKFIRPPSWLFLNNVLTKIILGNQFSNRMGKKEVAFH